MLLVGILTAPAFTAGALAEERNPNVNSVKIMYMIKISQDSHFVKFKACIGNKHAVTPTFAMTSDISYNVVKYQKMQQANTCQSYDTTVKAKYSNSITIKMTDLSGFV